MISKYKTITVEEKQNASKLTNMRLGKNLKAKCFVKRVEAEYAVGGEVRIIYEICEIIPDKGHKKLSKKLADRLKQQKDLDDLKIKYI